MSTSPSSADDRGDDRKTADDDVVDAAAGKHPEDPATVAGALREAVGTHVRPGPRTVTHRRSKTHPAEGALDALGHRHRAERGEVRWIEASAEQTRVEHEVSPMHRSSRRTVSTLGERPPLQAC